VEGTWSDGICDCGTDITNWCIACWVIPYRWALTLDRSGLMPFGKAFVIMGIPWLITLIFSIVDGYWAPGGWFTLIGSICVLVLGMSYREKLRRKYNIMTEDSCRDCVCWWCCSVCAAAQEGRHVDRATGHLAPLGGIVVAQPQYGAAPAYGPGQPYGAAPPVQGNYGGPAYGGGYPASAPYPAQQASPHYSPQHQQEATYAAPPPVQKASPFVAEGH